MCMHLTESHVYVFNRITKVCIYQDHKRMHLTGSHVYALKDHTYAFNRITGVCI